MAGVAVQIHEEYEPDCLRLCLINNQMAFHVVDVAQQRGSEYDAVAEPHIQRCVHNSAFYMAFFLRHCCCEAETHLAIILQRENVLGFEEHAYRLFERSKLSHDADAVHDITRKSGHALCNN